MSDIHVKIYRINPLAKLPAYATAGSVGLDLQAMEDVVLLKDVPVVFGAGIALAIPAGYEGQVRPRSSLSKRGVDAAFGTIDSDYRGEVGVVLMFLRKPWRDEGTDHYLINAGDRIAQLVISPVPRVVLEDVESIECLGETVRGDRGFGSSGK